MPVLSNPKHELFAQHLAKGDGTQEAAALAAGYAPSNAAFYASRLAKQSQISARINELVTRVAEKAEWDSAKVLIRLGEIVDVKAGDFDKPRSEWTEAMERVACEVEEISERSHDGVQAGDSKSWDTVGTRVRIRLADKIKALELIGRHKAVDAFVQQKAGDTNILVVTAETARKVRDARKRLEKVVEKVVDLVALPVVVKSE